MFKVLNEDHFECRCQTYTIIEVTLKTKSNVDLGSGWSGASCCHIRFINEMLLLCEFTISLHYAELKVLKLQSKCGIKLFCCDYDAEFVTIYNIEYSNRKIISCDSSPCQYQQRKSGTMKNVENATDLCPHLEIFKTFMWENHLHEKARTDHDIR